jgi:hypothetical protein
MNSPIQARPVARGLSGLASGASQSGCDIFSCGGAVINCAAQCIPNPLSPGCIACLGPAWGACKDCF